MGSAPSNESLILPILLVHSHSERYGGTVVAEPTRDGHSHNGGYGTGRRCSENRSSDG